ncbi:hypothetical protein [Micromonospora sp. HM5-17]|uniref:hypothetical protein n=1 Tax=Micromonospora sp. HM5-17 TaxID=2487710 RepID=UPI000F47BF46|nr:hypothetical protein [Micromonospora sp. HM5-17]ROT26790.1 hypothetical protein EF879_24475 [Micromonospora sp. HM5-17]
MAELVRRLDTVLVARLVAAAIAVVMVHYFATSNAIRADNPFLVPDAFILLSVLVSPLLPRRAAVPAMIFAFGWSAGVLTVSLFTYVVRDEFPVGHLFLIGPCLILAALLGRVVARQLVAERLAEHRSEVLGRTTVG